MHYLLALLLQFVIMYLFASLLYCILMSWISSGNFEVAKVKYDNLIQVWNICRIDIKFKLNNLLMYKSHLMFKIIVQTIFFSFREFLTKAFLVNSCHQALVSWRLPDSSSSPTLNNLTEEEERVGEVKVIESVKEEGLTQLLNCSCEQNASRWLWDGENFFNMMGESRDFIICV